MVFNYKIKLLCVSFLLCLVSCQNDEEGKVDYVEEVSPATITVTTDKASYKPGETVTFTADKVFSNSLIRYTYLGKVIKEETLNGTSWNWLPPATDFKATWFPFAKQILTVPKLF